MTPGRYRTAWTPAPGHLARVTCVSGTGTEVLHLLDAYCCGGIGGDGYAAAGFRVTGVDIKHQRCNPRPVVVADAMEYIRQYGWMYDVLHASPPSQRYSHAVPRRYRGRHPDLVGVTRDALNSTGRPWVMENVPGAPLQNAITLCGGMFGVRVRRHRLFEFGGGITPPLVPPHVCPVSPVRLIGMGRVTRTSEYLSALSLSRYATQYCCEQAIPPAYTQWIGRYLIRVLGGS